MCLLGIVAAAGIRSAKRCASEIVLREYTVPVAGVCGPVRTILVSDLHNREYGEGNAELLRMIAEQTPDAIFAPGDIFGRNAKEEDAVRMLAFLSACAEIAPTFYSPGNHEEGLVYRDMPDLYERVRRTGCAFLNDNWEKVTLGGTEFAVGGTIDSAFPAERTEEEFRNAPVCVMLEEMLWSGLPTILLAHKPESVGFENAAERWPVDLMVSGHTHGGVIRFPFLGGVVSPGEGLFPQYDVGEYTIGDRTKMIIGAGLSGYDFIPRIFNPPEICMICMVPPEEEGK